MESRKARSRANTISVTFSPGQPVDSWPETQIIKICHSPIFSCRTVLRSSHGMIVHCQSLRRVINVNKVIRQHRFAYRSQAISGSFITIKGVTNIRFLVKRAHAATPAATTRWPVSTNRGQVLSPGLKQPRCKPRCDAARALSVPE